MYGGCISNRLDHEAVSVNSFMIGHSKSIRIPTFCSYRESVSQSNEVQVYVDHNNTSVALVHPVI